MRVKKGGKPYLIIIVMLAVCFMPGLTSCKKDPDKEITGDAPWWGSYSTADETKTLDIVNFNGESFDFSISTLDGLSFEGVAAVDGYSASYMDMIFAMGIQGNDVSIWIDHPLEDSAEREPFKDTYFRESDDDLGQFSYEDEEYRLLLYYPDSFVKNGESDETTGGVIFPSQRDNAVLRYWVIPNTYGETEETFVENTPAEEINIYNNVVIGWKTDINQETGVETPVACFWVVEPDWIACVAISCETSEQASEWCRLMIEDGAVMIDTLPQD